MSARSRLLVLVLALGGLGFAGASTWIHHRLIVDPSYISPCDINATFNCTQVYLSRFGSIGGVPVALGGVIWFSLVALVAAFGSPRGPAKEGTPVGAYLFLLATIGLATILYLGYASFFVIRSYCLLCMGTYACVLGIFLTTAVTSAGSVAKVPRRLGADIRAIVSNPTLLLVALVFLAGSASAVAFFPRTDSTPATRVATPIAPAQDEKTAFEQAWAAQPRVATGVSADGAKVVIIKFNDWQCPSCKAAFLAYQPVLQKYEQTMPGVVKYVTKDFPLNSKCNVSIPSAPHGATCEAAAAVRMAPDKAKAEAMALWCFNNQEQLTPALVRTEAASLFGVKDFDRAYAGVIDGIRRDVSDGIALQIHFTPTYFINGVRASDPEGHWLPAEYFDLAIQYELKHPR